ncbi:MAG: NADH dehydrogenase, partial [uncultured Friedmanniella sp.]
AARRRCRSRIRRAVRDGRPGQRGLPGHLDQPAPVQHVPAAALPGGDRGPERRRRDLLAALLRRPPPRRPLPPRHRHRHRPRRERGPLRRRGPRRLRLPLPGDRHHHEPLRHPRSRRVHDVDVHPRRRPQGPRHHLRLDGDHRGHVEPEHRSLHHRRRRRRGDRRRDGRPAGRAQDRGVARHLPRAEPGSGARGPGGDGRGAARPLRGPAAAVRAQGAGQARRRRPAQDRDHRGAPRPGGLQGRLHAARRPRHLGGRRVRQPRAARLGDPDRPRGPHRGELRPARHRPRERLRARRRQPHRRQPAAAARAARHPDRQVRRRPDRPAAPGPGDGDLQVPQQGHHGHDRPRRRRPADAAGAQAQGRRGLAGLDLPAHRVPAGQPEPGADAAQPVLALPAAQPLQRHRRRRHGDAEAQGDPQV